MNRREMCLICKEQCPVNAVVLDDRKRPYVDSHKCVGCGACENACPLDEAAIKIISI
ncbi:4Fe-4S binding protein [Pelosinus baikalensis]|uniref:4Fe-4S binding protein n=1 Tax=Pelosinus baikalensis TaxID=2892015 RepID=A0ABS8HVU8_9FIRM|nr:4Fe-4S binding protein [Pelosinus baikalensis]MCC5466649.1 4Fe-4S binding protein [Pelosinus baikalensis]